MPKNKIYKLANFKDLLKGKNYFLVNKQQILYFHERENQFVLAEIDPNKRYFAQDYAESLNCYKHLTRFCKPCQT